MFIDIPNCYYWWTWRLCVSFWFSSSNALSRLSSVAFMLP